MNSNYMVMGLGIDWEEMNKLSDEQKSIINTPPDKSLSLGDWAVPDDREMKLIERLEQFYHETHELGNRAYFSAWNELVLYFKDQGIFEGQLRHEMRKVNQSKKWLIRASFEKYGHKPQDERVM